jgi:hypothetical protein
MEKNSPSDDVIDLLQHSSSIVEESSCYNNITYNINEVLRFSSFILLSRFYHEHNLRLAYLLSYSQWASLTQASAALGVTKTIFHTQILPDNPSILSEKRPIAGWGRGGKEKIMILSSEAKELVTLIRALVLSMLGEAACQKLRIAAENIRKGVDKIERKQNAKLEMVKANYLRKRSEPGFRIEQYLPAWRKMSGLTQDELLKALNEGGAQS